jgi:hypothetical protein
LHDPLPEYGFTSKGETEIIHQLQRFLRRLVQVVEEGGELHGGVVLASRAGDLSNAPVDVRDGTLRSLKKKRQILLMLVFFK